MLMLLLNTGIVSSCSSQPQKQQETKSDSTQSSTFALDQERLDQASYVDLSANLVHRVIHNESVDRHLELLKNVHPDTLENALDTPRKRLAFWINIYNGYTQHFLKTDPTLYKNNRSKFFNKEQIPIAGYTVSMEDVEHGVLRRGSTVWSKGYVRIRAFRKDFIQKYAVETVDYRIHFALNCGAKSCPPVMPYKAEIVAKQLNDVSRYYLNDFVEYNQEKNLAVVPSTMSWFSADFGGSAGEKRKILKEYGAIPEDSEPKLEYTYDWTMMVENYADFDY